MLGVGWIVLIPLIRMSIYTFVFGFIFKARFSMSSTEGPLEFALGIFLGLTVFQLIADGIGSGPSVILRNSNLVKKIAFPVIVLPVAAAASSMFNFLVGSIVTMIAVIALGIGLSITQFWYVAIVVPVFALAIGLFWLFAALGVFLRDIGHVTQLLSMLLLFSSAIFYPLSMVPESIQPILLLNPLVHAIELSRQVMLWHESVSWTSLAYLYLFGFVIFILGYNAFKKMQAGFADVI